MNYKIAGIERDIIRLELMQPEKYASRKHQFLEKAGNSQESINDFLWGILNEALSDSAKDTPDLCKMYTQHRTIYNTMIGLLLAEGKKVTRITKLRNECDMKLAQLLPYEAQISILPGNRCTHCPSLDGLFFSLQESISAFPLNYDLCDREDGCTCLINTHPLRDKNDLLILKNEKKVTFWEKVKRRLR